MINAIARFYNPRTRYDSSKELPVPRTTPKIDSKKQLTATTAAKASRVKEGGLGGPRTGRASASTKRVQAKRDSKGK